MNLSNFLLRIFSANDRLLLFVAFALFLFASSANAQLTPTYGMSAAYDADRQQIVYFGGYVGGPRAETWIYDGTNFVKRTPLTSPPAQQFHSMAYDDLHRQVVLVLGNDLSAHTWTWNGTNWQSHTPLTSPTPRDRPVIGYDKAHNRMVLFGGLSSTFLTDTWLWDGTNWSNANPANHPTTSGDFRGMAFDELVPRLVESHSPEITRCRRMIRRVSIAPVGAIPKPCIS